MTLRAIAVVLVLLELAGCAGMPHGDGDATLWRFDRLDTLGGLKVRSEGTPQVVETDRGLAVLFDGVDDALFVERHPLAGAGRFTFEAVFRPGGGAFEQRWFHLAEAAASPPDPNGPRLMFEIRVTGDSWYLDAFAGGPNYRQALVAPAKRFPLGRWYHVAQVYDGRTYRAYAMGCFRRRRRSRSHRRPRGSPRSGPGSTAANISRARSSPRASRRGRWHRPTF